MRKERSETNREYSFIREPFRSAVTEYLKDCKSSGYSPMTVVSYLEGLRHFFRWLESNNPEASNFNDLSRSLLSDYQMFLYKAVKKNGGKYSIATQHERVAAVLRFTEWLTKEEKILINPGESIHLPKRPKTLPRNYLNQKEANKLLRAPDITTHLGLRNRAILETLYSTAIRNSELRSLRIEEVNHNDAWLMIRQGKGRKDRVVPIGKAALYFIQAYLEKTRPVFAAAGTGNDFLFISQHGEKLHQDTLNQIIRHAAEKAGIKQPITAHSLRHTCATLMLRGRADIRHIQEMLGHKSLASTQIYTRVEIADLKRIHHQCHPREKEAIDRND